ncbi:MAG TPA: transcriptional regulator [Sphingomonas sp.]|jgi:DNA-binding winged helix-turn-helix (wHTH) protein|uniref:winged helix-turn-helix domain-containing protein n=1 Tax=Sphingomonas sp. TaxID=28214 RepID=UPI002ED7C523
MNPVRFRFGDFLLDLRDRRLTRGDAPVELNARYLDALALLVGDAGRLVTKDRFMAEVWRGVPVTDEALTQCVKMLRRRLGDSASAPRFIETVPKHGYRFIAPVTPVDEARTTEDAETPPALPRHAATTPPGPWRTAALSASAGTLGAGVAGLVGGLVYGFAGAARAAEPGMGAASVLLVLTGVTLLTALAGGGGVAFGIAAAGLLPGRAGRWSVAGGALGGMAVGAVVELLGLDAFDLLTGRTPGDITGALEGALLGGAVGVGPWLAGRFPGAGAIRRGIAAAALAGAAAGVVVPRLGGRLMGGSLDRLADGFPASRLRLDRIGALFGETGFGPLTLTVTGALEGALFGACVTAALLLARRGLDGRA